MLRPVQPSLPNYSETMYWGICDQHTPGLGMFLHTGRVAGDLNLWWARTIVFLPGGEAFIARTFGRAPDDRGPATGNSRMLCVEEHRRWMLTFDGAGEVVDRQTSGQGLVGGGPAIPMRFELDCTAMTPVWDMEAALGLTKAEPDRPVWAHGHQQQALRAIGSIQLGNQQWDFDGFANRDHSWGPRDVSGIGGDAFLAVVFPNSGRLVMAMTIFDRKGQPDLRTGYVVEGDRMELFSDCEIPRAVDTFSNPRTDLKFSFRRLDGHEIRMTGEVLNGAAITMLEPNHNLNGAALGCSVRVGTQ